LAIIIVSIYFTKMRQSQDSNANFNRDEIVSREQCPFQVYQGGNGGNAGH